MNALSARLLRTAAALLGALLCALPLVSLVRQPAVPWGFATLLLFLIGITWVRPGTGLLFSCAMLPFTFGIEALLHSGLPLAAVAECLVLAFIAGAALSETRSTSPGRRWRLAWPALLMGALVSVSAVNGLVLLPLPDGQQLADVLWSWVTQRFFRSPAPTAGMHHATAWIEFVALAAFAERALARTPDLRESVLRIWIVGGAAAASFAALRLAEISLRREDPWSALLLFLQTQRITVVQTDPNAAGSFYALYFVAAVLLGVWSRKWWIVGLAGPLLLLGLFVTQSRSAVVAVAVVCGAIGLGPLLRRRRVMVAALVVAAVGVSGWLAFRTTADTHATFGQAFTVRAELTKVALEIARDHPVFGVGIGGFVAASSDYIDADLIRLFPPAASGENAHNNLLQILAELGITGLLAFLWLVGAALRRDWRPQSRGRDAGRTAMIAGLAAFLLTALAGHPLLQFPVGAAFFLALGIAAGLATETVTAASRRGWVRPALVLAVIATLPFRIQTGRTREGAAVIGAGEIAGELDGVVYRRAEQLSQWTLPAGTRAATFRLRWSPPGAADCGVTIQIDGRPGDVVRPVAGVWMRLRLTLPPADRPSAPRVVELQVDDPRCQLLVGTPRTFR